jgi:CRISPR-associated endonuclease Csy4
MKYYIEITILPSADIGHHFLWEKIFQQVHLGLVEMKDSNGTVPIGISLPEYNTERHELGSKLRLFATSKLLLETLNAPKWLGRFMDYVHLTRIRPVPYHVSAYACYSRQQPKSSKERLARRKAKRERIELHKALELLEGYQEQLLKNPFITMTSQSSGKRFCLFILKEDADQPMDQGFSSYGLSQRSTVPEF